MMKLNRKENNYGLCVSFLIVLIALLCGGCGQGIGSEKSLYSEKKILMATTVRVDVCVGSNDRTHIEAAYKEMWERLVDIAWRMNVFDDKSDVAKVNASYEKPVVIGQDTYDLIGASILYSKMTKGTFDITIMPLIDLWKTHARLNELPNKLAVDATKEAIGPDKIKLLANNTVQTLHRLTKIDLGGIAKGYAIDEAARILRKHHFKDFQVDAGGDIYVGGHNCKGKLWRIGIRDPRKTNDLLRVTLLSDAALTTSGNYVQYLEIAGERFSHIINPLTGYPQRQVMSASVIAPSATEADALSTALCVMDKEEGTALINSFGENYASLIVFPDEADRIVQFPSDNFKNFLP